MIGSDAVLDAVRPRLRHFVAVHGDAAIALIKARTGIQEETIGGWLAATEPPAQPLLKVWHLLDLLGYASPEISQVDSLQQYVGRLYAMGVLDNAKLMELLNVTVMQTAVQFLRGQKSMKLKAEDLPGLHQKYDATLGEALAALPRGINAIKLDDLDVAPKTVVATPAALPARDDHEAAASPVAAVPGSDLVGQAAGDPVVALAILLGIVFPLASRLVLEGTPEDRARLRALLGMPDVIMLGETVRLLDALRTRATHEEYMRDRP